jgi:hypothetical protein
VSPDLRLAALPLDRAKVYVAATRRCHRTAAYAGNAIHAGTIAQGFS